MARNSKTADTADTAPDDGALIAAATTLTAKDDDLAEIADTLGEVVEVMVVVSAPAGPRRRAGHAFGIDPVRLPVGDLSAEELAAINADPALKVSFEPVTEDEAAQAAE